MTLFQQILVWLIAPNLFLWAWVWLVPTFVIPVDRIYAGAMGWALPGLILLRRDVDESFLRHELQHVRQVLAIHRWGPVCCWRGITAYRRFDTGTVQAAGPPFGRFGRKACWKSRPIG